jgi:hypothetical protein
LTLPHCRGGDGAILYATQQIRAARVDDAQTEGEPETMSDLRRDIADCARSAGPM